jgi:hypothetical protein
MHQKDDADFAKNLNRVRDGSHTVKDINILQTRNSEDEHHDMLILSKLSLRLSP